MKKQFIIIILAFFLVPMSVNANGWWGKGAKSKDWLLKHGGTWMPYEIKGVKSDSVYIARMYLLGSKGAGGGADQKAKSGDLIEQEFGTSATFDDAINNKYRIKIFEDEKEKMSAEVTARPGEITKLTFDLGKDTFKKKTEVEYKKGEIVLNDKSIKYISHSDLDAEKPIFTRPLPETLIIAKGKKIEFEAADDETGVDHYKVKLLGKNGLTLRDWKKQNENYYFIPEEVFEEVAAIRIRAFDKADHYAETEADLKIEENEETSEEKQMSQADEKVESVKEPEKESGEENEELKNSLAQTGNEIMLLKSEINEEFKKINRRNFLVYFLIGPDKKSIEMVGSKIENAREKISIFSEFRKQIPQNQGQEIIEENETEFLYFLGEKEADLTREKKNLGFWNRLRSFFRKDRTENN